MDLDKVKVMPMLRGFIQMLTLFGLCAAAVVVAGTIQAEPIVDSANTLGILERLQNIEKSMAELSQGFQIGTIIFCLSDHPPGPNWVPCDGISEFGSDDRIPAEFRGKKVPNMQDAVVAVGTPAGARTEGLLAVQQVKGENFKLPAPSQKRMHENQGNARPPEWRGGFVGVFTANGDYLDVQHHTAHWACYGGLMESRPAIYEYHPENTQLIGQSEISPPTHVFLRAYVRVR